MAAQQSDQELLGGGFAGAARAEEPEDLAAADGEVHTAHGRLGGLRIGEGEPADADHLGHDVRRYGCRRDGLHASLGPFRGERGAPVGRRHRANTVTSFRPDFPERRAPTILNFQRSLKTLSEMEDAGDRDP